MPKRTVTRTQTRGRARKTLHPAWNPRRFGPRMVEASPAYGVEMWAYLLGDVLDIVVSVSHAGIQRGTVIYKARLPRAQRAARRQGGRTR